MPQCDTGALKFSHPKSEIDAVKIAGLTTALNVMNQVQDRKEGEGGAGQNAYENLHQQRKEEQKKEVVLDAAAQLAEAELSLERLKIAVADYEKKPMEITGADGIKTKIHASMEGKGPGLRVILTDSFGKRIRAMMPDEFIDLRDQTLAAASAARGRLLDKKC